MVICYFLVAGNQIPVVLSQRGRGNGRGYGHGQRGRRSWHRRGQGQAAKIFNFYM